MHRFGNECPAGDLLVGVQTWRVWVALTDRARLGALTDDEARGGPLAVVLGGELGGSLTSARAVAGERSHHEAVGQLETAELIRGEKVWHGGSSGCDCSYLQPATSVRLPRSHCEQCRIAPRAGVSEDRCAKAGRPAPVKGLDTGI